MVVKKAVKSENPSSEVQRKAPLSLLVEKMCGQTGCSDIDTAESLPIQILYKAHPHLQLIMATVLVKTLHKTVVVLGLGSLAAIQRLSRGPGFSLYISQDIKGNAGHHRLHCCGFAISRSKSVFQWHSPYPVLTCGSCVCVCVYVCMCMCCGESGGADRTTA